MLQLRPSAAKERKKLKKQLKKKKNNNLLKNLVNVVKNSCRSRFQLVLSLPRYLPTSFSQVLTLLTNNDSSLPPTTGQTSIWLSTSPLLWSHPRLSGLQEIGVANWEESGVLCFPSRRGLKRYIGKGALKAHTEWKREDPGKHSIWRKTEVVIWLLEENKVQTTIGMSISWVSIGGVKYWKFELSSE